MLRWAGRKPWLSGRMACRCKSRDAARQKENPMSKALSGKVAVVTGGSRGIGAAIARRLAADGAKVAITYTKGLDAAKSVIEGHRESRWQWHCDPG